MKHPAPFTLFIACAFILLFCSVDSLHAAMNVDSISFDIIQNFYGANTEYNCGIFGFIDEEYSYVLLKGPDPDGAGGSDPPILADSRLHEFDPPTAANGYRFLLFSPTLTTAPATGNYTAEIFKTDSTPAYTRTIAVETRNIPTATPVITFPTPDTYFTAIPLGFTWEPYTLPEDESIAYSFEFFDSEWNMLAGVSSGTGTMGVYNSALAVGRYHLLVFAQGFYSPDPGGFTFIRTGIRSVEFGRSAAGDLDGDGDVDGVDLAGLANNYGTPVAEP